MAKAFIFHGLGPLGLHNIHIFHEFSASLGFSNRERRGVWSPWWLDSHAAAAMRCAFCLGAARVGGELRQTPGNYQRGGGRLKTQFFFTQRKNTRYGACFKTGHNHQFFSTSSVYVQFSWKTNGFWSLGTSNLTHLDVSNINKTYVQDRVRVHINIK